MKDLTVFSIASLGIIGLIFILLFAVQVQVSGTITGSFNGQFYAYLNQYSNVNLNNVDGKITFNASIPLILFLINHSSYNNIPKCIGSC